MFKNISKLDFTGASFVAMFCDLPASVYNTSNIVLYASEVTSIPRKLINYSSNILGGRKIITVDPIIVSSNTSVIFDTIVLLSQDATLTPSVQGDFIAARYQLPSSFTLDADNQIQISFGNIILEYEPV